MSGCFCRRFAARDAHERQTQRLRARLARAPVQHDALPTRGASAPSVPLGVKRDCSVIARFRLEVLQVAFMRARSKRSLLAATRHCWQNRTDSRD